MKTSTTPQLQTTLEATFHPLAAPASVPVDELVEVPNMTYYRSRLFTTQAGSNPLVNAAQPLLALLSRLLNQGEQTISKRAVANIEHELKAFRAHISHGQYESEVIHQACFCLRYALAPYLSANNNM